jgi:DNA-binding transcriptional ArsR family regulator
LTRVYNALSNPYRRQIIQILKERGKAGFKELHESLRISVGALYHHLDNLEGLVAQQADKKYVLTDGGRTAIDALSIGEEKIISNAAQTPLGESRLGYISRELLFGRTLFNYLNQDQWRSLPLAFMVLAIGGLISLRTNLEPILLFYLSPTPGIGQAWFLIMFPLGWFITFAVADLLCYLFFHRRGGELSLLNGTALAMTPLLLVPGMILLIQPFSSLIQSATTLTILIQVAVQVWVVCLLSSAISIAKGLRMERTALVSLAVMYLNITAVILALQLGLF